METCEISCNFTYPQKEILNGSSAEKLSILQLFTELDEAFGQYFDTGDPEVKTWFLVRQNTLAFLLCGAYILFVKVIGPAMMRNRRPLDLRKPMILFNLFLVAAYTISMITFFVNLPTLGFEKFCHGTAVRKGELAYTLARCCWFLYVLKYIEFLDTIFFILRKKENLVTNLHVVHHTIVPLAGWIMMRTERSGFQSIPVFLNGFVHILMYTYYGLAAVGPQMKKYLWWKKYLTMLQMVQFILIILFVAVIAPSSGCLIMKSSLWIDVICGITFLILFYNFYAQTFIKKGKSN
ncbi:Elongation of very long chain fatty acids protein 7 [Araneus ventricosus]|uniref:Elongation of very long chain fatty acids protein n=1 Tax=Araneus ventricosus TaxID=182803 RepID=A0A4Y2HTF2_ARAVE|nr:Elongation of very long chain fatty acids protein 7 [Araneus ventricosus]